jgi:hypothetical protein
MLMNRGKIWFFGCNMCPYVQLTVESMPNSVSADRRGGKAIDGIGEVGKRLAAIPLKINSDVTEFPVI